MSDSKCKICRRAGEKLFLKGEKCFSNCTLTKKPYPPGIHGKGFRKGRRTASEYGAQMREKQKVKFLYGLREKQFVNYVKEALKKKGAAPIQLAKLFESRLDNVAYRLGFASERSTARQMVSHGHITVNGKRVNIPSYRLKVGDKIAIRKESMGKGMFKDIDIKWKKYEPPAWLSLDKNKKQGVVKGEAVAEDQKFNLNSIIELYSR
jgi:small subunit ribosomal protein S4